MKDSNNQYSHLNEWEKKTLSQKTRKFIDNTKKAVRDVVAATWIAVSTLMPTSVESLSTIAPTAAKVVAVPTAAALVSACHDDLDTTPPRIDIVQNEVEIQWWETLRISGNQVYIWNTLIFRCSDNVSSSLNISLTFNWKSISSWYVFNEAWTLNVRATDEAGNISATSSAKINKKEEIKKPEITVLKSQVDISKWWKTSVNGKEFFVWNEKVITWTEDNCTPSIKFEGKDVAMWYEIDKEWVLTFTLTNNKWVSDSKNINAVDGNEAPEIDLKYSDANIFWGVKVTMKDNELFFWDELIAKWTDDNTKELGMKFEVDGKEIKSWETLNVASGATHVWKFTVTDEKSKSSDKEIKLENDVNSTITWLDNLNKLTMQVDNEVNLLNGISFNWVELVKVEIEIDGKRYEVSDPYHYKPNDAWSCKVILTVKWKFGNSSEISSSTLTIKGIEYQAISISNIKPVDILPIIGQVESWDGYSPIEHLRVAEATRIRDMMWKYGTKEYSAEEYQKLMMRLHTWIAREVPEWYNKYEILWWTMVHSPSNHATIIDYILTWIINNYVNLEIVDTYSRNETLLEEISKNQNNIYIFWCSQYATSDKERYNSRSNTDIWNKLKYAKNGLIFAAWTNIASDWNAVLINKIYNHICNDNDIDEHWVFSLASIANSNQNDEPYNNIMVTIPTNKNGDINQTNEDVESAKVPTKFSSDVLFSGRTFPSRMSDWTIFTEWWKSNHWKYASSYTNYFNVALTDLCFHLFAKIKNVHELLDMIRSTALTDYIRFDLNGDGDTNDNVDGQPETQPLQLINPAWVFKKYCMISDIPSTIKAGETITLTKWRYKWIIFDIPWAEVKINWQWIPYNKSNESLIKSQNPMNLEWRLNANEAMKYGNKNLKWKMIAVDDQWNGLNMDKEISVNIQ